MASGPFVGRSRELDLLLGHVDDLAAGRGNVVEITGEPGIGKSRLLLELRRRLPEDLVWREGHCSAGAAEVPYLPIADLLRNAFGVEEHDDPDASSQRVDAAAAEWSARGAAGGAVPEVRARRRSRRRRSVIDADARIAARRHHRRAAGRRSPTSPGDEPRVRRDRGRPLGRSGVARRHRGARRDRRRRSRPPHHDEPAGLRLAVRRPLAPQPARPRRARATAPPPSWRPAPSRSTRCRPRSPSLVTGAGRGQPAVRRGADGHPRRDRPRRPRRRAAGRLTRRCRGHRRARHACRR